MEIIMKTLRRRICLVAGSWLGLCSLTGCIPTGHGRPAPPAKSYSEDEQRRIHKYRSIDGYQRVISGAEAAPGLSAQIFDEHDNYVETGTFSARGSSISAMAMQTTGPFQFVSVKVFEPGSTYAIQNAPWGKHFSGTIIGQWKVPVADRIPDDLLDELRQRGGSLRIKIRLHREGVLLGWDIERRPGFDPKKRDSYGEAAYVSPGWVKTGGDFKEARGVYWLESDPGVLTKAPDRESIRGTVPPKLAERGIRLRNGFLFEPGWYIHPKSGERIETDF